MVDLVDSCEWKHERNDNNWLGKADELSVSYCFANDSAAACNSSSEADSKMEKWKQNFKCQGNWIHAKETILDLGASSIHGSKKRVDSKTVLGWFGALVLKKTTSRKILAPTALGPSALHTVHTLLLRHWHHVRVPRDFHLYQNWWTWGRIVLDLSWRKTNFDDHGHAVFMTQQVIHEMTPYANDILQTNYNRVGILSSSSSSSTLFAK